MITDAQWRGVADWLAGCTRPMLVSHRRPDGDALGSVGAMHAALRKLGLQPTIVLYEPFPPRYAFLELAVGRIWEDAREALTRDADGLIILDTCAFSQLEPIADFVRAAPRTLVIDHHATRDEIGTRPGDLRIIDPSASATCLLVAEWIRATRLELMPLCATALFTGLATDCGWFRFSNTDARTLRAAAELVDAGASVSEIYAAVYQQEPVEKLKLIGRMLSRIETLADGQLVVLRIRNEDFAATGATQQATEDVINEAVRLAGVEVTVLFSEQPDGVVRVNLRSRRFVDVAQVAKEFGGGGHARAAGARAAGALADIEGRVIARLLEALRARGE